ncbi:glycoside hydrolase family 13 protein [Bacillus fonticola]|uniref:glycoside hydrolase family 13 protein n=1 Tax=Bacillus fonticola TaxID=2728853 RepID=UPI001472E378|nr:glycoside hydrolase family 13 protein [Bacillus fonticola]
MLKEAILHNPTQPDAYACTKELLHIRLRTKKEDVTSVTLHFGDPYDWQEERWQSTTKAMSKVGHDDLFDYWLIEVAPPFRRMRYAFLLEDATESLFYCEKGFYDEVLDDNGYFFCFPFLNPVDSYNVPAWVKDTVWYQIFPERFANGDHSLNPKHTLEWNSTDPTPANFFGGDLQGVIDHLDYLAELGINGLYFTPLFTATSNHKYDTIDYLDIDPQFGDKETFRHLVKACHKRGIRVMLDAVFNHSGFYFPQWQDVVENGESSRYKDWFYVHEFPLQFEPRPNYDVFAFTPNMPKLNTEHPEVKEYLLEVGRYWVREFDIDGWRLDVANEVDHAFWREFRNEVKSIKPDVYILGEIWHNSINWLRGEQFDAVMNYPFQTNLLDLFSRKRLSPLTFQEKMTSVWKDYPQPVNDVLFNLVGSHDTPRILTECNEDKDMVKAIFTLLLTSPGSPCLYYGDEIGLTGGMDPGCRKCMPWDDAEQDTELKALIQQLIQLRHSQPLFANEGELRWLYDSNIVAFTKSNATQSVLVAVNPGASSFELTLPDDAYTAVGPDGGMTLAQGTLICPAKSFGLFHAKLERTE